MVLSATIVKFCKNGLILGKSSLRIQPPFRTPMGKGFFLKLCFVVALTKMSGLTKPYSGLRGYLRETGTNSDRYELVPVRNFCSRDETGTKSLVDYMRPVRAQKQQILELYNLHNSII